MSKLYCESCGSDDLLLLAWIDNRWLNDKCEAKRDLKPKDIDSAICKCCDMEVGVVTFDGMMTRFINGEKLFKIGSYFYNIETFMMTTYPDNFNNNGKFTCCSCGSDRLVVGSDGKHGYCGHCKKVVHIYNQKGLKVHILSEYAKYVDEHNEKPEYAHCVIYDDCKGPEAAVIKLSDDLEISYDDGVFYFCTGVKSFIDCLDSDVSGFTIIGFNCFSDEPK